MDDIIFQIALRSNYEILRKLSLVSKKTRKNIAHNIFWYEKYKYDFSDKIAKYFIRFTNNNFIICMHQYKYILESICILNKILYVNNIEKNRKFLKTRGTILSYISSHELLRNIVPDEFYNKTKDLKFRIDYDANEELPDYYTLIIDSKKFNKYNLSFGNYPQYKNYVTTVDINVVRDILTVLIFHKNAIMDELFQDFYSDYNIKDIGDGIIYDYSNKWMMISIMRLGIYETIDNEKINLC